MKIKSFIILFIILMLVTIGAFFPIKNYVFDIMIKSHIIKKCYDKNNDFNEIFSQENINYEIEDKKVTDLSLKKLLKYNQNRKDNFKIPLITHHIYFTSTSAPTELNDFYIEKMKLNFLKLNSEEKNWQHFIWTNVKNIIPEEILNIPGVKIKQISEIQDNFLSNQLDEILLKANNNRAYFAEAADLLRLIAIYLYGGIYNDMDYEIYNAKALTNLMTQFDFIGGREMSTLISFYGNSFIAAKSNHPVLVEALKLSTRNYKKENAPKYIQYPCKEPIRIYFNGPPLITIAYFLKNNIDNNSDIILPSWIIFNADFARYKNKICDYKKISKNEFIKNNSQLQKLLQEYKLFTSLNSYSNKLNQNIYYNNNNNDNFEIIGADMFCGNWVIGNKFKRNYYWFWQK